MKLKEIRKKKGITQKELAKKVGLKQSTISGYEIGNSIMNVDTLLKVIDILDCSADELLGIEKKKQD